MKPTVVGEDTTCVLHVPTMPWVLLHALNSSSVEQMSSSWWFDVQLKAVGFEGSWWMSRSDEKSNINSFGFE